MNTSTCMFMKFMRSVNEKAVRSLKEFFTLLVKEVKDLCNMCVNFCIIYKMTNSIVLCHYAQIFLYCVNISYQILRNVGLMHKNSHICSCG